MSQVQRVIVGGSRSGSCDQREGHGQRESHGRRVKVGESRVEVRIRACGIGQDDDSWVT